MEGVITLGNYWILAIKCGIVQEESNVYTPSVWLLGLACMWFGCMYC